MRQYKKLFSISSKLYLFYNTHGLGKGTHLFVCDIAGLASLFSMCLSSFIMIKLVTADSTVMYVNKMKGTHVLAFLSTAIHQLTETEAVQKAFFNFK